MASFADALTAAKPEQVHEYVARLVERVDTTDQQVAALVSTGPARPFFDQPALCWRPRTDVEVQRPHEALAWYVGKVEPLRPGLDLPSQLPHMRALCALLRHLGAAGPSGS